ncbi:LD-carboxypeptidase [Pricia sp. S334]|uniref:LD-carboxypeptidase n=1 Tax=Pricia mediterranea TaxID=3076079 RepID=A0ABU3L8P0_9FLAO|nr:LD-carboxypeptidase [Pricia sp. S334]MDT7829847.1 LD-carboxypeptidase [Pricia sp. S334]
MTKRREFMASAMGLAATAFVPQFITAKSTHRTTDNLLPKRLKKGDTIGLIAPGYSVKPHVLDDAKKALRTMGFKPYHTERIIGNFGYFSNTDSERVADLNEMFANPDIDGILCARGGYGCTRILPMIDYENIRENPKALIGFSDVTALLNAIYQETGLVGFHGPVGSTLNDPYSMKQLRNVVMRPKKNYLIENVELSDYALRTDPEYERYTITPGTATGKLVGGSLTLVNALIGTPHEIDLTDAIVCLEDVEEAPYRIDRMLTQLIEGDTFTKAAGIAFGVSAGCNASTNPESFTLKEVLMDRLRPLNIPAVYGMSFGHVENNFTFPIGINATLNTQMMTLELLQRAVV